jgi:ribonuclease BN (tRNA processing enzyme)
VQVEVLGFRVGAPLGAPCSSYAVSGESALLLLDCGPGALERLWERRLAERLDAIVISHMHMDHMLDLLPFSGEVTQMALRERSPDRRPPALHVPRGHGPEVLATLSKAVGSDFGRFRESFDLREYDESDVIEVEGLRLTFAPTAHPQPCFAARVTDGRSTFVYGADGAYSEALISHAAGADLLLLEATYVNAGPELARDGHMNGEQAGEVAQRAGARRLLLTHIGPWAERNAENLRRARERFPGEVELVSPGAVYTTNGV